MSRRWAAPALTALTALGALCPRPAAAEESEGRVYRVAAIGDSHTDARKGGGKYLAYLRQKCPKSRFDNFGKGGENVQQMRRRFKRDVFPDPRAKTRKPSYTHVIVFGGVNDLLHDLDNQRSTDKILADLGGMYQMARSGGMRVIGITLSPWSSMREHNPRRGRATSEINAWLLAQHEAKKIDHAVDAYALLSCGELGRLCKSLENPWIRDGLHFNADAHAKLGKALHEGAFADCR